MTILYEEEQKYFEFDIISTVKKVTEYIVEYIKCPYEVEISLSLVDKASIRAINSEFRNIDKATDVLSFPMMEYDKPADFNSNSFINSISVSPETDEIILGDIVICVDVVKSQAKEYGHSELREFSFLVCHSLLHLFGFDHIDENDRIYMEKCQKEIMKGLGINR